MFEENYSMLHLECQDIMSDDQKWEWIDASLITHYLDQRVVDVNDNKLEKGRGVNVNMKNFKQEN